jgi:hypothetical protein
VAALVVDTIHSNPKGAPAAMVGEVNGTVPVPTIPVALAVALDAHVAVSRVIVPDPPPPPEGVASVQSCRQNCVVPAVPFGANPCAEVETLPVVTSVNVTVVSA